MAEEKKIKRPSDAVYRIDVLFFKIIDLFRNTQQLLDRVPVKPGMKVVDYGCGIGSYSIPLAEMVGPEGRIFAVDIQPLAIEAVEKKASKRGLTNVEAILVDSYDTGIEESSIDLVLIIDTIHRIEDCDAMFQEMHRILRQDATLFLDKGHMEDSEVRKIVESTDLFRIVEDREREILLAPSGERNS
jgi:ubiquinone/menaquinone biosynthesis C-methylase UbiE